MKKLALFDLDGTLFDTKNVNFLAYQDAMAMYGYKLDYDYYCKYCNGRHYMDFLPEITTKDTNILSCIHQAKQSNYCKYLSKATVNWYLLDFIQCSGPEYYHAIVTTASKKNCIDLLNAFGVLELFDRIYTQEDVSKRKPDPEGYLRAMSDFNIPPQRTVIFEDSEVGIQAAHASGANYCAIHGFN